VTVFTQTKASIVHFAAVIVQEWIKLKIISKNIFSF